MAKARPSLDHITELTGYRPVDADALEGPALRAARLNNASVEAVREAGDPLCTLIAEVRWGTFRLGRKDYADAVGLHAHAVQNVETAGKRPEFPTFEAIHAHWAANAKRVREEVRERFRQLVAIRLRANTGREAAEKKLDVPPDFQPTIADLYRMWAVAAGRDAWEKAMEAAGGCKYSSLWQREAADVVPDYGEVDAVARALRQDRVEAAGVWTREKVRQLIGRKVEPPVARLAAGMQTSKPQWPYDDLTLRKKWKLGDKATDRLVTYDIAPYGDVEHVAAQVIPEPERERFEMDWRRTEAEQAEKDTFGGAFAFIRDDNGLTNRDLAVLMDIKATERDEDDDRPERKEGFRPSAAIRATLERTDFSSQAPAGVLIALAADPSKTAGPDGEPQDAYLRRLFLERMTLRGTRTGNAAVLSPLRQERAYWGVEGGQLKEPTGYGAKQILDIENGRLKPKSMARLLAAVTRLGQAKVDAALGRLEEINRQPTTVVDMVNLLRRRSGGWIPLVAKIQGDATSRDGVSTDRLRRIASGQEVPPWPVLTYVWQNGDGVDLTDAIKRAARDEADEEAHALAEAFAAVHRDWFTRYADMLAAREDQPQTSPMARFLQVLIGASAPSVAAFCREHDLEAHEPTFWRQIGKLNKGERVTWEGLSRFMDAAELQPGPRRRYAELLHHHEDDHRAAVGAWRGELRRGGKDDPEAYIDQLGLTSAELKALRKKKA